MKPESQRRLFLFLLLAAALVAFWLDRERPFPVRVIRNTHETQIAERLR